MRTSLELWSAHHNDGRSQKDYIEVDLQFWQIRICEESNVVDRHDLLSCGCAGDISGDEAIVYSVADEDRDGLPVWL